MILKCIKYYGDLTGLTFGSFYKITNEDRAFFFN